MEESSVIEKKIYDLLKQRFTSPCPGNLAAELVKNHIIIREVQVAACHLSNRIQFYYREFVTKDKKQKWYIVAAVFDSLELTKLENCYSTSAEAKEFFVSLKNEFCEVRS